MPHVTYHESRITIPARLPNTYPTTITTTPATNAPPTSRTPASNQNLSGKVRMRESVQSNCQVPGWKKTSWKVMKNHCQEVSTSNMSTVSNPVVSSPPPNSAA